MIKTYPQGTPSRRRSEGGSQRKPVAISMSIIRGDGSRFAATILDISADGALLMTQASLAMSEMIALDMPDSDRIVASVQWSGPSIYGCQFASTLPKSVLSSAFLRSGFVGPRVEQGSSESAGMEGLRQRIVLARQLRHWTQADLARAVGVSKTTVCNWETGKARPRQEVSKRLQAFLSLTEGQQTRETALDASDAMTSDNLACRVRHCRQLVANAAGVSPLQVRIVIDL